MRRFVQVTLLVTDACNLRCKYCYQHQKKSNLMTWETAKQIIDDTFSCQYVVGCIYLMGGEPFLAFDLI